jgi:hypothetical protein
MSGLPQKRRLTQRSTAKWLMLGLDQAQQAMFKASSDYVAERAAVEAILNVIAELSAATKVISDAYFEVWSEQAVAAMPRQVQTAESDARFRKAAAPRGSVKLTHAAVARIRSFMRQIRHRAPNDDYVASIGWASGQQSKHIEDKSWTNIPDGLRLARI